MVSEDDRVADFHNKLERLRDPSHVKSLKLSEWKRIFQEWGLRLDRVALSKVRLEVLEWANRAGFPEGRIKELIDILETAPAKVKRSLSVFHRNGLVFFLNTRAILVGTRQQKLPVQRAFSLARGLIRK